MGRDADFLPSGTHVLVCSVQIKPQRVTNSGECYKEKVEGSRRRSRGGGGALGRGDSQWRSWERKVPDTLEGPGPKEKMREERKVA